MPKHISRRTSYYQVRLAFHSNPQLIPRYCTADGFGPPPDFHRGSSWPWVAHLASGLTHTVINALLTLGFPTPPSFADLDKTVYGKLVGSFCKKHAVIPTEVGTPTLCKCMISGTISLPLSGYFSPFPHGTSSLSIIRSI